MESHHSITTHPQILPSLADANSQYDLLNDYVSRQFSAGGVPSPFLDPRPTESEILRHMTGRRDRRRALAGGDSRRAARRHDGARRRWATVARRA